MKFEGPDSAKFSISYLVLFHALNSILMPDFQSYSNLIGEVQKLLLNETLIESIFQHLCTSFLSIISSASRSQLRSRSAPVYERCDCQSNVKHWSENHDEASTTRQLLTI